MRVPDENVRAHATRGHSASIRLSSSHWNSILDTNRVVAGVVEIGCHDPHRRCLGTSDSRALQTGLLDVGFGPRLNAPRLIDVAEVLVVMRKTNYQVASIARL